MMQHPLVSIGVPIYNDAPWLRNALDHLLSQEHQNLEINIADNGSTDGSREICRDYARRDSRIRFFENKHNIGGSANHRLVYELSTGDYFTWGSGHDYFEPSFIRRTLEVLQANPSVVLCGVATVVEDGAGRIHHDNIKMDTRKMPPAKRFIYCWDSANMMNVIHGLYRSEFLHRCKSLALDSAAVDRIFLGELSLLGDIMRIDEVLHHRVETWLQPENKDSFEVYQEFLKRQGLSQDSEKKKVPILNMIYELHCMINRSLLSPSEKEVLFNKVRRIAHEHTPFVQRELAQLSSHAEDVFSTLDLQPNIRRFTAMQVLAWLERAFLLGFDGPDLQQARLLCMSALGNNLASWSGRFRRWGLYWRKS